MTLVNYTVLYVTHDGQLQQISVPPHQLQLVISDLMPGKYNFSLHAVYSHTVSSNILHSEIELLTDENVEENFMNQAWFYVVIGAGLVLLIFILVVAVCICKRACCNQLRKGIYCGQCSQCQCGQCP